MSYKNRQQVTEPGLYRKKPVVVEAMQFDGTEESAWAIEAWSQGAVMALHYFAPFLIIRTLEGDIHGLMGDWIIKGVAGEFYPIKPDIFKATYESVETGRLSVDCCTDESEPCDNELCYRAVRDYGDPEVGL